MKLGKQTGSLMNHIEGSMTQPLPKVGDGATMLSWTDRHPATVIKVTRCTVTVQEDTAKRTDKNGMSECQTYDYSPNPAGSIRTFRRNSKGQLVGNGRFLFVGRREKYHDYSF